MIHFINPRTGNLLRQVGDTLQDCETGEIVGRIREAVPRFVDNMASYADSFGYQWNQWESTLSDARAGIDLKRRLILQRTKFDEFDTAGKTLLECGMGGGDDTEILLSMPFADIYTFDLSNSVDRAAKYLNDARLHLFQASILDIPLPDRSFDFVFCHRVLQHTPDPRGALRAICRKVKPGGVLFVHSYNRSLFNMMNYKYKYRWITRRLPHQTIKRLLDRFGPALHRINERLVRLGKAGRLLAYSVVPFESISRDSEWRGALDDRRLFEFAQLLTFDALTPCFDKPMRWRTMKRILGDEGFVIRYAQSSPTLPLWCTATFEPRNS
jgi:ubiquinone/menaquinone biosynthesis C-methylase UbiE